MAPIGTMDNMSIKEAKNKAKLRLWRDKTFALCHWCDFILYKDTATLDHLIPISLGGTWDDCVLTCFDCNHERGVVTEVMIWELKPRERTSKRFGKKLENMKRTCNYPVLKAKWDKIHEAKGFDLRETIKRFYGHVKV